MATFFVCLIAGQLSASLLLDHIGARCAPVAPPVLALFSHHPEGAFGFDERSATALRIVGVLTAFAGVAVIQYARKHDDQHPRGAPAAGSLSKLPGPPSIVIELQDKGKDEAQSEAQLDAADEEKG